MDFFFLTCRRRPKKKAYTWSFFRGVKVASERPQAGDTAVDENCISEDVAAASYGDHP